MGIWRPKQGPGSFQCQSHLYFLCNQPQHQGQDYLTGVDKHEAGRTCKQVRKIASPYTKVLEYSHYLFSSFSHSPAGTSVCKLKPLEGWSQILKDLKHLGLIHISAGATQGLPPPLTSTESSGSHSEHLLLSSSQKSVLTWQCPRVERFCFVLFLCLWNTDTSLSDDEEGTEKEAGIDRALQCQL